jgi:hypothetical protein
LDASLGSHNIVLPENANCLSDYRLAYTRRFGQLFDGWQTIPGLQQPRTDRIDDLVDDLFVGARGIDLVEPQRIRSDSDYFGHLDISETVLGESSMLIDVA